MNPVLKLLWCSWTVSLKASPRSSPVAGLPLPLLLEFTGSPAGFSANAAASQETSD